MKNRWLWVCLLTILGLVMLGGGLLVPMHLRAVDASVIAKAGRNGPALLEQGQALAGLGRLGAAQLLALGAQRAGIAGWDRLAESVTNQARQHPAALMWGDDSRLEKLFSAPPAEPAPGRPPIFSCVRKTAISRWRICKARGCRSCRNCCAAAR